MKELAKKVIENNLKLGYTVKQIQLDMDAALQRSYKYEVNAHNQMRDAMLSDKGISILKNR